VSGNKERGNEGIYGRCILYAHENRRIKPVEIFLRRGKRGRAKTVEEEV
jgi:hypothetical protein